MSFRIDLFGGLVVYL